MCHSFTVTDGVWDSSAPAAINQAAGEVSQNNRVPTKEQKERTEEEEDDESEDLLLCARLIL